MSVATMVARLRARRSARKRPFAFFRDYRRAFPYLKPHWRLAVLSSSMVLGGAAVAVLAPWPFGILIDTILEQKPLPSLLGFLGGLDTYMLVAIAIGSGLALTIIQNSLGVLDDWVNTKLDQRMVLDFRSDLFKHAQQLSLAFHDRTKTGGLMYQLTYSADAVGQVLISVPPLVQALITLIAMFIVAYLIEPQLALAALVVVPGIYYSIRHYARRIEPHLMRVRELEGQTLSIVHEAMSMLRVIVAFGREPHEFRKFREQGEKAVDARVRVTRRQTMFALGVNTITAAGTALVLWFGANNVLDKNLSPGELVVIMGYIAAIYQPMEQISGAFSYLQEQFMVFRAGLDLLDTEPDVKDAPDARPIGRTRGEIEFREVSFNYATRETTLKNVSFAVEPGQRVAIVGPTGAGKTTLISLLMRFYDPSSGQVLIDGKDLRSVTLRSLREQMSIVMQEPLLFSGSIEDNIRYGRLDATFEDVADAARAANAHDFIERLPHGYGTEIGERGAQLSGGERQRIAVARSFLKNAPILILDEPTSSVDSKTESLILDALDRLMEGRTTFMIAHRLSTVRNADVIFVIRDGALVEQGSHEELLDQGGLYKQLWDTQISRRQRRRAAAAAAAIAADPDAAAVPVEPTLDALLQATPDASVAPDAVGTAAWSLFGAISAALKEGSPDALRALARHRESSDPELRFAGEQAAALLEDVGGLYNLWKDTRLLDDASDLAFDLDALDPFVRRAAAELDNPQEALRLLLNSVGERRG